ncbi:tetratricopeptide repeat protein [Paraburkholderia tropica]|uniref:tetratricopeptide repeat-containing glycosyltransferase family protein n=1 Tax=Paraburkholderia tropica TaxID=92647 RepID=UPI001CC33DBD|nr:tetratricopeptide repeat-containing glycosyltransferase family protein [Paraburkholderia tropica]
MNTPSPDTSGTPDTAAPLDPRALHAAGRHAEALAALDALLQHDPANLAALHLAARCLHALDNAKTANDANTATDGTSPELANALLPLGNRFYARKQLAQAEHAWRAALAIEPDWPSALGNLGLVLRDLGRMAEAEAALRRALELAPNHAGSRSNLALLLWGTQRLDEAHAEYRRILAHDADNHYALNNLGLLLLDLNRQPEAEAAFRHALAVEPNVPEAHNNLGNALNQQARTDEAIDAYRQALALRPDYTVAKGNLAMLLLRNGQYADAWPLYEARHDEAVGPSAVKLPPLPWPHWSGEPLDGKSIIVWPEQGYGDDLQFCRYVTLLKARGAARVSVACGPALGRLFESLENVDAVYPLDGQGTIARHDYWCFMMSLPLRFGTTVETIPAPMPYLRANAALAQTWRARLDAECHHAGPKAGFKVGLVWAGAPRPQDLRSNAIDQRRSTRACDWLPILRVPGVRFVSLQKGETTQPQILELPPELRPLDPMDEVHDFADTAAIVDTLDLVITVDTSMAHLAGALGKPVWILSRYDACWRWLRERDDSPWYPRARLFQQRAPGEWSEVIERVARALEALRKE